MFSRASLGTAWTISVETYPGATEFTAMPLRAVSSMIASWGGAPTDLGDLRQSRRPPTPATGAPLQHGRGDHRRGDNRGNNTPRSTHLVKGVPSN
jgi:hypothetical protein